MAKIYTRYFLWQILFGKPVNSVEVVNGARTVQNVVEKIV